MQNAKNSAKFKQYQIRNKQKTTTKMRYKIKTQLTNIKSDVFFIKITM